MLLAGDIGGTKTLLGLFSRAPLRPLPVAVQSYTTTKYASLVTMVEDFLQDQPQGRPRIEAASLGVAGPVIDDKAELTNVGWRVDGRELAVALGLSRVRLFNDLVAIAHSVPVLDSSELHVLQAGEPNLSGNAALIAAGTGHGPIVPVQRRTPARPGAVRGRPCGLRRAYAHASSAWPNG